MAGTLHMPLISFPSCQLIMKLIQSGFLVTSYLTSTNHEQCGRLRHQGYVMDYVEYYLSRLRRFADSTLLVARTLTADTDTLTL